VSAKLDHTEVMRTLSFCLGALASDSNAPAKEAALNDLKALAVSDAGAISDEKYRHAVHGAEAVLTAEQLEYLNATRKNESLIPDDLIGLDSTGFDVIDGLSANLVTGQLGLVHATCVS